MSTWPILKRTEYQLMLNEYMKRLILLFVMIGGFLPLVWANGGCDQRLTREEFRARQQAYITEKAGLTKEEADKFFPLYFELQDRKKELNDEAWRLLRKGKDENISEDLYEEIMIGVYDARVSTDRLERSYLEKFRKVLSYKKIYKVLRAEMRFNRDLLKGMHRNKGGKDADARKGK